MSKGIGFLLLPVYTRFVDPEGYGILSNLEAFGQLSPVFLSLYLDAAFKRLYYDARLQSSYAVRVLYSTFFWFILGWGGAIGLLVAALATIGFSQILSVGFLIVLLIVFTQLFNQLSILIIGVWRAEIKAKKASVVQIAVTTGGAALSIFFLVFLELGWRSRIIATGISACVQLSVMTIIAVRNGWLRFLFDRRLLRQGLRFSVPLIPNIAGGWITGFSDRIVLAAYGFVGDAGVYSVAARFGLFVYLVNDALTQVQGAHALRELVDRKKGAEVRIAKFLEFFSLFLVLIVVVMSAFAQPVLELMTPAAYWTAYPIIIIVAWKYVFSGIYRVFSNIIIYKKIMWVISSGAIVQAVINLILNLVFVPMFGMYAAALSTTLAVSAYTIWLCVWSQRVHHIPVKLNFIILIFIFGIFITFMLVYLSTQIDGLMLWGARLTAVFLTLAIIGRRYYRQLTRKLLRGEA